MLTATGSMKRVDTARASQDLPVRAAVCTLEPLGNPTSWRADQGGGPARAGFGGRGQAPGHFQPCFHSHITWVDLLQVQNPGPRQLRPGPADAAARGWGAGLAFLQCKPETCRGGCREKQAPRRQGCGGRGKGSITGPALCLVPGWPLVCWGVTGRRGAGLSLAGSLPRGEASPAEVMCAVSSARFTEGSDRAGQGPRGP